MQPLDEGVDQYLRLMKLPHRAGRGLEGYPREGAIALLLVLYFQVRTERHGVE